MKKSIALFAICIAAHAAFADVVSLAPGQQVVIPASQPGSVPVVIEAGLLKQSTQFSFLPALECRNFTATQLNDPNGPASDQTLCDYGGISLVTFLSGNALNINAIKPATIRNTYAQYLYNGAQYPYLLRKDINGTWAGIKIDLINGVPTEVTSPIEYTMTDAYFTNSGLTTGGAYRERNMRLVTSDKKVYSDVAGVSTATKSRPSVTYKQVSFPMWTFDSWEGPALPTSKLAFALTEAERTRVLTEAGFKVTPIGDGTLYAVGSYKTLNLRMTTEGQVLFSDSLGLTKYTRSALRGIHSGLAEEYNPMSFSANIGYFIN
jgi:hypothetical protein